ncbi:hypothetical protein WJX74_001291 [Apatococcus lobatus]
MISTLSVHKFYGESRKGFKDFKTTACAPSGRPHPKVEETLQLVPEPVLVRSCGCGFPFPVGIDGLKILDLGCGCGRDAYLACALVGPQGFVTGIDLLPEQVQVAEEHADSFCQRLRYPRSHLRFMVGSIEDLKSAKIEDGSQDILISNCVINLSFNKQKVFDEAYRVLTSGGEFHFSDMYIDRHLDSHVLDHQELWGEGLLGALTLSEFEDIVKKAGFSQIHRVHSNPIAIVDEHVKSLLGSARYQSVTHRVFKLPQSENVGMSGQIAAAYLGSISGQPEVYRLSQQHEFKTGLPTHVDSALEALLSSSWLAKHFHLRMATDF